MKFLVKIAAFWAVATLAQAQAETEAPVQTQDAQQSAASAPLDKAPLVLPEEKRWRLGAALGYGMRSNPLILSDDIPVIIDVDIAWFGDRWFFDNGDLGVELIDNSVLTTNLVARVNSDRAFFGKTNTKNVTFSVMAGGVRGAIYNPPPAPGVGGELVTDPQPLKPPDRDYAIELGFETLMSGEWGQATLRAFHDVSGTHHGYEISADYGYRITRGRFSLSPMVGLAWKSDELSDYYWGVHADEASNTLSGYQAKAGLSWEAALRANYYLSKSMRLALSANYERLQHSVAMSPLVVEDHVFAYFAGVAWQF
jgi:outer membrane protein